MSSRVPVLYQQHNTFIHRLDPRIKMVLALLMFVFLFTAPGWPWMLGLLMVGVALAFITKTPWQWLLVLWLVQVPSFLVIMGIPLWQQFSNDEFFVLNDDVASALRLILAWSGTIFFSVSLFSTMDAEDLVGGLRGLGVPSVAAFSVGLTYRLLYTTLNEAMQISDAMKLKGVDLQHKNYIVRVRNSLKLSLPILFSVLRRGPNLIATLTARGALRSDIRYHYHFGVAEALCLLMAFGVVIAGAMVRFAPDTLNTAIF